MAILGLLVKTKGDTIIDYQFSTYFGQIFYEKSGNSNHVINGNNNSTENCDTIPTDRGAYFNNTLKSRILLPPNEAKAEIFNLDSTSTITIWVMFLNSSNDNTFFTRYISDKSIGWNLLRTFDSKLKIYIKLTEQCIWISSISETCNNGILYIDIWHFIVLKIVGNSYSFFLDGD